MSYGPHASLVQEVIDLVESGKVLRDQSPISDEGVQVITDLQEATQHAWEEELEGEMTWADLREREKGNVYAVRYRLQGFESIDDELSKLLDILSAAIQRHLPLEYTDLMDDAVADLHACAFSRAVSGASNPFFERLFAVYRAGGWPCGWSGRYPEGKLVAYQPSLVTS